MKKCYSVTATFKAVGTSVGELIYQLSTISKLAEQQIETDVKTAPLRPVKLSVGIDNISLDLTIRPIPKKLKRPSPRVKYEKEAKEAR